MALDKEKYTIKEALEIISKHMKALAEESSLKKGGGFGPGAGPSAPKSSVTRGNSASVKAAGQQSDPSKKHNIASAFGESSASGSNSGSMKMSEKSMSESSSSSSSMNKKEKSMSESSSSSSLSKMEADNSGGGEMGGM